MMEVISVALRAENSSTLTAESLKFDSPVMSTYDELLVLRILSLSLMNGGREINECCSKLKKQCSLNESSREKEEKEGTTMI